MRKLLSTLLLVCLTGLAQEDNDVLYIQPGKEVYETGEDLESGNLIDGVEGVATSSIPPTTSTNVPVAGSMGI